MALDPGGLQMVHRTGPTGSNSVSTTDQLDRKQSLHLGASALGLLLLPWGVLALLPQGGVRFPPPCRAHEQANPEAAWHNRSNSVLCTPSLAAQSRSITTTERLSDGTTPLPDGQAGRSGTFTFLAATLRKVKQINFNNPFL